MTTPNEVLENWCAENVWAYASSNELNISIDECERLCERFPTAPLIEFDVLTRAYYLSWPEDSDNDVDDDVFSQVLVDLCQTNFSSPA